MNYKTIKISDIFFIKRGKRIIKRNYYKEKTKEYKYPVITATTLNNSVDGFYNKYNSDGNIIVCGGEASGMFSTYQKLPCWIMDRARILNLKNAKLNKYIALYFITLFNKNRYKYAYNRSANPTDIGKIKISVPWVNNRISYSYIQKYIEKIYKSKLSKIKTKNTKNIAFKNEFKYTYFKIKDIFPKKKNYKYSKTPILKGLIPHITSTDKNNGVKKYCTAKINKGNVISVSTNGKCFSSFYHKKNISISSDVELLYNSNLNLYSAMYIITILKQEQFKYSYGRKPKNDKIFNTYIMLPYIIKNNKKIVNWNGITNYIKKFPNADLF